MRSFYVSSRPWTACDEGPVLVGEFAEDIMLEEGFRVFMESAQFISRAEVFR
jgi:hypothetical protein